MFPFQKFSIQIKLIHIAVHWQYNSWFTFSEYGEPVTVRSCRPIHAKELTTVSCKSFQKLYVYCIMVLNEQSFLLGKFYLLFIRNCLVRIWEYFNVLPTFAKSIVRMVVLLNFCERMCTFVLCSLFFSSPSLFCHFLFGYLIILFRQVKFQTLTSY